MKRVFRFTTAVIVILSAFSCKKRDEGGSSSGQILVNNIILFTQTKAAVSVSIKGSFSQVSERGICWGTLINPTARGNKKPNFQTGNQFTDTLNLAPATKYYVRAYLVTAMDTVYSGNATVTTNDIGIVFDKHYPVNQDSPDIIGVVGNETEGFTICSRLAHPFNTNYALRLTKIDAYGNLLWSRDYDDGTSKEPKLIRKLADGYLVASTYWKNPEVTIVLRKFDLNGNSQWETEFKKDLQQFFVQLLSRNNLFLVTMRAYSTPFLTDPGRKVSLWDFMVDNNGAVISEKEYPDFTRLDSTNITYNAIETPEKGFFTFCDYGQDPQNSDVMAHLFDPQYARKWRKIYETPVMEVAMRAVAAPNGNYVIAGYQYNLSKTVTTGFVFELSKENGNKVWEKFYDKPGTGNWYYTGDIIQHPGGYYMGSFASPTMFISSLDNFGQVNWEYEIPAKPLYNAVFLKNIYLAANNHIYVFGMRRNTSSGTNPPEIFMIRMKI